MTASKAKPSEKKARAPKLDVLAWQKKIRRTNAKFAAASAAEKRVMLAKDVLASLSARRIRPTEGTYYPNGWSKKGWSKKGLADAFVPGTACQVCAKGALFVAKVDRLNEVTNRDADGGDPSSMLMGLFSKGQLDLIEHAFETRPCFQVTQKDRESAAARFGHKHKTASLRLEAIVKNKGEFVP